MREHAVTALRLASGAGLMAMLLAGAHAHVSAPGTGAVLRVALRTSAGTAQVCRRTSAGELAATPVHMRRAEICETHAVPYRLEVHAGANVVFDRRYEASGVHGDRPLTVNEDIAMPAGRADVRVRFAPVVEAALPAPVFTFEGPVDFPAGRIRVATLDPTATRFELR